MKAGRSEIPDRTSESTPSRTTRWTPREDVLSALATIPGIELPRADRLPSLSPMDLGEHAGDGIPELPAKFTGEPYPAWVSAVDACGNELGGLRMPDVAVPVATHTGFNPRHAESGGDGQILEYLGSTIPLARTAAAHGRSPHRVVAPNQPSASQRTVIGNQLAGFRLRPTRHEQGQGRGIDLLGARVSVYFGRQLHRHSSAVGRRPTIVHSGETPALPGAPRVYTGLHGQGTCVTLSVAAPGCRESPRSGDTMAWSARRLACAGRTSPSLPE